MRSYWLRILLGALAVFCIGMVGVSMFRRGRAKVTEVVGGSGPLTIPLPFVPFQLDGSKLGMVERLVVNRDGPKKVSSVDLQVKLDDSLLAHGLAGCRLAANLESDSAKKNDDVNVHVNRMGERAFFFCAKSDSALVPFGTVTLQPGHVTVPLLVPGSLAETLHSGHWGDDADSSDVLAERAESLADHAEQVADSIQEAQQDQEREVRRELRSQLGDSLRAEGKRRADSVHKAVARMVDSLHAK